VASTIIGYNYRSNLTPRPASAPRSSCGIAPEVTIIPVKVLADYQMPALPD
jgi:hypothetical protein